MTIKYQFLNKILEIGKPSFGVRVIQTKFDFMQHTSIRDKDRWKSFNSQVHNIDLFVI